ELAAFDVAARGAGRDIALDLAEVQVPTGSIQVDPSHYTRERHAPAAGPSINRPLNFLKVQVAARRVRLQLPGQLDHLYMATRCLEVHIELSWHGDEVTHLQIQ